MWERFSYYGMRAILIYYLTDKVTNGGLGFADSSRPALVSLYTSMVYLLCLGGGWVADRITASASGADRRHPHRRGRVLPGDAHARRRSTSGWCC